MAFENSLSRLSLERVVPSTGDGVPEGGAPWGSKIHIGVFALPVAAVAVVVVFAATAVGPL